MKTAAARGLLSWLPSFLSIAVVLAIAFARYAVDPVVPESAPATVFSGARARSALARVLGDGAPHPTGSAAAEAVRARIVVELAAVGLAVERRRSNVCGRYGTCAEVENLVTVLPGTDSTGAVLFVAHSDSVPRSPGASDDGAGVAAILEGARVLRAGPPLRNDVILLIDDGEELGLLGAEAFVRDDPRASAVRAVVNVEARGVRGPATLFQTGHDAGFLVDVFARAAPRPMGSSLFSAVYERMPNDTDLTVFLERGVRGLNFAFSDGPTAYHTPNDDLAHQHPGSVQHLGESAVASVRALASIDLRDPPRGDRVFFDLFGATVVRWPAGASLPLAVALLAGVFFLARARLRETAIATALFGGVAIATALVGIAALLLVRPSGPWLDHPEPLVVSMIVAPFVIAALGARARSTIDAEAMELGALAFVAAAAVALAAALPGASYLAIAPALVWLASFALPREARMPLAAAAGFATWALPLRMLYPGLGVLGAPAIALSVLFAAAPLWPLARRRGTDDPRTVRTR